jgi:hypothetical protein
MDIEDIRASLLRAGFEEDEIPALLGNIDVETGGTFDYQQVENTSNEQKGYGLFQFTGGHLSSYLQYLEDTDQEDSADAQIKFVYANIYDKNPPHEIGAGNQKKIQKAFDDGSSADKSDVFGRWYERFEGSEEDETWLPDWMRGNFADGFTGLFTRQHPSYNERYQRSKKYD